MSVTNKEKGEVIDENTNEEGNNTHCPIEGEEELPPDGGWGWIVAIGASVTMGLNMMVILAFGIIYSRFLRTINATSVTTAWIYNINGFMANVTQLFAPPLCDVFGLRKVAVVGSLLFSSSIFLSTFATTSWHLLVSFALLGGTGAGLSLSSAFFIVPKYFKKRRGAAMAIMMSGSSVGLFGGSLLTAYLQEEYAFSGGTLILSAVCLHCLPAALVFQPVSRFLDKRKKNSRKYSDNKSLNASPEELSAIYEKELTVKSKTKSGSKLVLKKLYDSVIDNFKMFKSCRAVVVALVISLSITGFLNFNMMIPFWLQDIGFSMEETALCVSIGAILNLVARIVILFASDAKFFNVRIAYPAGLLFLAFSSYVLTFLSSRIPIFFFVSFFGSGIGLTISLFSLLIINVMGMKDYQPTFGLFGFFKAIEYVTIGPAAGWIRDSFNYKSSLMFTASVLLFSVLLYAFLPLAILKDKASEREREREREELNERGKTNILQKVIPRIRHC